MKKMKNGKIIILFLATIAIIVILGISLLNSQSKAMQVVVSNYRLEIINKSDSIRELRALMSLKLKNNCDTLTVDQRLRMKKLDEYSERIRQKIHKEEGQYLLENNQADFEALKTRGVNSNNFFAKYFNEKTKKLRKLAKDDPVLFKRYAISEFWGRHSIEGDVYEENTEIEKKPLIKAFNLWDSVENKKYQDFDKSCQIRYEKTIKLNKEKYQNQVSVVETDYQNLIKSKKAQLGL